MTRTREPHERFAEWLAARGNRADEDPPRDLALHAAGCERCLRAATAMDTLRLIDVGAVTLPPLRVVVNGDGCGKLVRVARYAVAATALVLLAGSMAIGSSWLGAIRPTDSTGLRPTTGEGVLAGVPSTSATPRPTPTASASLSARPSPSARASDAPADDPAPTFANPDPTFQPPPPPPPTVAPTVAPSATPVPTRTAAPTPTSPPTPIPTSTPPPPTPTPTPTLDDCEDGIDNDGDLLVDGLDPGCVLDGDEVSA